MAGQFPDLAKKEARLVDPGVERLVEILQRDDVDVHLIATHVTVPVRRSRRGEVAAAPARSVPRLSDANNEIPGLSQGSGTKTLRIHAGRTLPWLVGRAGGLRRRSVQGG